MIVYPRPRWSAVSVPGRLPAGVCVPPSPRSVATFGPMDGGPRCGPRKARPLSISAAPEPRSKQRPTARESRGHSNRSRVWSELTITRRIPTGASSRQRIASPQPRDCRIGRTGRVFDALLVAIVTQKVTGKEAGRGMRHLARVYSSPAPGPMPLRLPPDPERLAAATYFDLHPLGIEQRRADTIRRAASDAGRIERLADASPVDACTYLERIRGIGVWTSAETVAVSHGDSDAVSVGDFHLKNEVAWHLTGRPRGHRRGDGQASRGVQAASGQGYAPAGHPRSRPRLWPAPADQIDRGDLEAWCVVRIAIRKLMSARWTRAARNRRTTYHAHAPRAT